MEKSTNLSSEVCLLAHRIYETWSEYGSDALEEFLEVEVEIPGHLAAAFAQFYHPSQPPVDICPVMAAKDKMGTNKVFEALRLQLPSFRDGGVWPKNQLAWWVMRRVFGVEIFDFHIVGSPEQFCNKIHFSALPSTADGKGIPFGLAALEAEKMEGVPAHVVRKSLALQKVLGRELGLKLAATLLKADFIFPPTKEVNALAEVLARGLKGETVLITGAFCPDYSYRPTGRPDVPYQYTFENVGDGVGLVAQQFARVLPHLVDFLKEVGIPFEVKLGIGDFEANSGDILKKVGLSREEFHNRCRRSLVAFKGKMNGTPVDLRMFELEWANGRWQNYTVEARERLFAGDYGSIKENTGKDPANETVKFLAKACRKFYCDWYGREMSGEEISQLVLGQGAEYAALTRIIAEDYPGRPIIQVAGDRPKMQVFNAMYTKIPTLCTKRVY